MGGEGGGRVVFFRGEGFFGEFFFWEFFFGSFGTVILGDDWLFLVLRFYWGS